MVVYYEVSSLAVIISHSVSVRSPPVSKSPMQVSGLIFSWWFPIKVVFLSYVKNFAGVNSVESVDLSIRVPTVLIKANLAGKLEKILIIRISQTCY